jgi:excisionase family DNA binding protein
MVTVPEAARRIRRNPETVRRWIREGKLRSQKIGTQHLIDERDLDAATHEGEMARLPKEWMRMSNGRPMINSVAAVHRAREGR